MVVGFNHNFRYKGEIYHVQTEDSGLKSPHIVTLLYKGGTILASKKTSYADITKTDHLDKIVEELMKDQHREMLRRLKSGALDSLLQSAAPLQPPLPASEPRVPPPSAAAPSSPAPQAAVAAPDSFKGASLDDLILSYLVGEDD
jgi:hypothetical protein